MIQITFYLIVYPPKVSTEWFRNWIGEENFNHPWTESGPICWNKKSWLSRRSTDPSDYLPQCGADVPKWICAVARNSKLHHYGSYELQIALSTLVLRPSEDVSVEAIENAIKSCADMLGNELHPCYNHGHWKNNMGDMILDAIKAKLVMTSQNTNARNRKSLFFHSFYNEYLYDGVRNGECQTRYGRGCRYISEEDYERLVRNTKKN